MQDPSVNERFRVKLLSWIKIIIITKENVWGIDRQY